MFKPWLTFSEELDLHSMADGKRKWGSLVMISRRKRRLSLPCGPPFTTSLNHHPSTLILNPSRHEPLDQPHSIYDLLFA
jgi:hypothetical protein